MTATEALLPSLMELADTEGTRSCLVVTHPDDTALAAQREDKVLLLVRAAHRYINNPREAPPFSAAMFHKAVLMALTQLRRVYDTTDRQQASSFDAFLNTTMPLTPILVQTVKEEFMNLLPMVEPAQGPGVSRRTLAPKFHKRVEAL